MREPADHVYTLSHAVDEACNHEDRVKVPLLLQVPLLFSLPGKGKPLAIPAVLNDPVKGQGKHSMEEDLGQEGEETKTAAGTFGHLLVIFH